MRKLFIKQLAIGPMMNFSYLVGDASSRLVAVIDPGWEAERIVEEAQSDGKMIDAILVTHTHFDHVGALEPLEALISAPVYVHALERSGISTRLEVTETEEGSTIIGGGLEIRCLHTPGHTPGSQCFSVGSVLFSGDTLLIDGCGRVDLPGGDPKAMLSSLTRLAELPDATMIYPGHDYGSEKMATMGDQRIENPYLGATSEEELF